MTEPRDERNAVFGSVPQRPVPTGAPENGFVVPSTFCPLPSNGVVYPEGHPLHLKEAVEYKAMTVREQDLLTNPAILKKGGDFLLTQLLKSCLVDRTINPDDLISGDRTAIITAIRAASYGAEYPATIECSACSAKFEREFDLSALPIKRLEIEPIQVGVNVFTFTLPVSGKTLAFKFFNGHDTTEMTVARQNNQKKTGSSQNISLMLLHSIVAVDGNTDRNVISKFVASMPAKDSTQFRMFIDKNEPGIVLKQDAECTECGHVEEVAIPIGSTFLFPETQR